MSDFVNIGTDKAVYFGADTENQAKMTNVTNTTLYYKTTSDVSSSSNDGNLTQGQSLTFSKGEWVIPASNCQVSVEYLGGEELHDQLNLKTGTSSSRGIVQGDVNLYRSAANKWKTDDAIRATGGVEIASGTPSTAFNNADWDTLTVGTDTACTNGDRYWPRVFVPHNALLPGIGYLIGSVGGTDKVIVELTDSEGTNVATSALAGVTVGTLATVQKVPFTATYAAVGPAYYFAVVQFNGTTAKFRTLAASTNYASTQICNTAAGTFGTPADMTPGNTCVADKGP